MVVISTRFSSNTSTTAWFPTLLLVLQFWGLVHVLFGSFSGHAALAQFVPDREDNDVSIRDIHTASLPECGNATAVCAMLQVNSLGVNHESLCSCGEKHLPCRLLWDTEDGHSITQGSDQYKFCGRAPVLNACTSGSTTTAYITRSVFNSQSGSLISQTDRLECVCSRGHVYVLKDSDMSSQDGHDIMEYSYTCEPLSTCNGEDVCRRISMSSTSFMVTDKCKCPHGLSCPSVGSRRMTRVPLGRGEMQLIRCQ